MDLSSSRSATHLNLKQQWLEQYIFVNVLAFKIYNAFQIELMLAYFFFFCFVSRLMLLRRTLDDAND